VVSLVGQREEGRLQHQREQQDGDTEITDQAIEPVQRVEERLGQEVEPAEVDRLVEVGDAQAVAVAAARRVAPRRVETASLPSGIISRPETSRVEPAGSGTALTL
jgi:hypothetical protein